MASSLLASSFIPKNLVSISTSKGGQTVGEKVMVVECSSRPQKKATKHHMKTRPRKTQPWDIKRGPTVYAPLPPLLPDWSLDPSTSSLEAQGGASPVEAAASFAAPIP
ncbi:50S ribosomal protein 6, chloroplastic [Nymphaea colorata]|uniref:50S ribosomal protein 6, chloroplastic n=1 Tax=Nymphaea colorata TaxID=210225 RepID=A0A5K1BUB0_9MAGN|nr:50S ribosomal protein 6, chloroplastic [Nymphaea colorata]